MAVSSEINRLNYFKELSFYNKPIENPRTKRLTDINLLNELPFYKQLSIIKTNQALKGYAMSYEVEIVEKKYLTVQLEASKSSIKDLFSDLLYETKGFKYQITVKVLLKKYESNGEIEFAPVYFNLVSKLVINHRFKLGEPFQKILYMIDAWINEGSGWIIESIESQYINISTYRPLLGNSYIELPMELRSRRKGLINIRNNDQKCFLWCHVRHINPSKEHPGEIKKVDKRLANILNYDGIKFPVKEKDLKYV